MSNKIEKILIIDADSRQKYLSQALSSKGYITKLYKDGELETEINKYDALILPIPLTKDSIHINMKNNPVEITTLFNAIREDVAVFVGLAGNKSVNFKDNMRIYDYSVREELSIKNAIPTAEGVLKIAIENLDTTVHSSKVLITGFGKTAKAVAKAFYSLGAEITVCARKVSDIAFAETLSYNVLNFEQLNSKKHDFNIVVNTVPSVVINRNVLESLPADCLIIEIASAPYGIDFSAASELNMNLIVSGSLPGKIAPETAGYIISEAILNIIKEENL